jgi:hypothetical protein
LTSPTDPRDSNQLFPARPLSKSSLDNQSSTSWHIPSSPSMP